MQTFPLTRRAALACMAASAFVLAPPGAAAQFAASDKPVRMVVPLAPGSTVDAVARALGPGLGRALGRPMVVENVAGAGGIPGTGQVVKAPKDGSVLGMVSSNHVINPGIYKSIPYDSLKDITPIAVLATVPLVLVVHPSVPAKTVGELLAYARARPGTLNLGSAGNGSTLHRQRSASLPDVPTMAEAGVPNYGFDAWIALIGPAGMPRPVVDGYAAAVRSAMASPEAHAAIVGQGLSVLDIGPDAAPAFFQSELHKHQKLVKQSGATLD